MFRKIVFAFIFLSVVFLAPVAGQDCAPPKIVANAGSANMFSPEQEMVFGELMLNNMSGEIRLIKNDELHGYINKIGEKLVKHLPPTGLKFNFYIVDIPEANAFNIPGGYVFLSRKLIAFSANEDELAGVMAHELGHAAVNHAAVDISESLRKILKVNQLGDRKDIAEKYNLLIENYRTRRISRNRGHENEQQLEADKIGLFSMVAAGYDANAFTSFFDRLAETEGKKGSWFSDAFGNTRPEQKRLRELIKTTEQLPSACRDNRSAKASDDFLKWQADVVSFRDTNRREALPGLLWKRELAPKLRSDIAHFEFSQDGKYLLAQDDFAVTVIERNPLQTLFQIPTENVRQASFTPDGTQVVLTTKDLHFERWSIIEKKPLEIREVVMRSDCFEHKLSPDGNFLACVDTRLTVKLVSTKTGKKTWEKKEFYPLTSIEYFFWIASGRQGKNVYDPTNFFRIEFSPDARTVMFSRSDHFRYSVSFDMLKVDGSEDTALALDLPTLKPIDIGKDIKKIASRPYIFLDSGRILGMPSLKPEENGIVSFPNGKRLEKFPFAAQVIKRTTNPNYLIIKPVEGAKLGVFDLKKLSLVSGFDRNDITMWNNLMVHESESGEIIIREIKYNETAKKFDAQQVGTLELPFGAINNLETATISNDFNWLLFSSKTRGGLWSLTTGERKFFLRGFKEGIVANDGSSIGEFKRLDDVPHSLVFMSPTTNQIVPIRELAETGAEQYGRFVLTRTSLKESAKKDEKKIPNQFQDEDNEALLRQNVRFELKDILQNKVVWSRDFPKDSPFYSFDKYSGRLILYWQLGSETGKAKLKEIPDLQNKATALGNKADDYLIEVVDAFAQKNIGAMLLETGKGSFDVGAGLSEGDWLTLYDSEGRVLVYSIKTGELRHRFFGGNAAMNPVRNQIAVENFPGEITIYNLEIGEPQAVFIVNGKAAFVRFNLEGNRLFVLSDSQTAYAFDLNKTAVPMKQ